MASADPEAAPIRDMSRAHWMRSVGTVAMTELAERFYAEQAFGEFDPNHIDPEYDRAVHNNIRTCPDKIAWAQAFALARVYSHDRLHRLFVQPHIALEEQMERHTHFGYPIDVLREGLLTQATFPINLAIDVSRAADGAGVEGYESDSLADIAGILRRPDFQTLVDEAAFTKNGFWGHYATTAYAGFYELEYINSNVDFEFGDEGVKFSPDLRVQMRQTMVEVNKKGLSDFSHGGVGFSVSSRSSSGCPVRHTRPHFGKNEEDQDNLRMLSEYFGKTAEDLLAERTTTVITEGLNRLATLLESAAPYVELNSQRFSQA